MKSLGTARVALVFIALLVSTLGCSPEAGTQNGQGSASLDIECQAFYRPSVGQAPDEGTVISLGEHGDRGTAEYADMVFEAQLSDDPGEGPALVISVMAKDSRAEILRQLYQIDRVKGLHNQFVGGHGFTGLIYTYHPASGAELQHFCSASSQS
jgi:hypothetical protein